MSRAFSFIALIVVAGLGTHLYMRQAQGISPAPGSNPAATVKLLAVQQDLLQIARTEQQHLASEGHYLALQEMRDAGDTGLPPDSRGSYSYSVEISGNSFIATATYSGPAKSGVPRMLHIGPQMTLSSE
jgi:hypothetical protein